MECFSGPTNPEEFDHLKLDLRVVLPHVIPSSSRFRLHVCLHWVGFRLLWVWSIMSG